MSGSPCADRGCTAWSGEWCDHHQTIRWDCICLDDDVNSLCPVHAPHDATGRPLAFQLPDYAGDPPDDGRERHRVELADGTMLVLAPDAVVGWYEACNGFTEGEWVKIEGRNAFHHDPKDGPPDGATLTSAPVGDPVHCVLFFPVGTGEAIEPTEGAT